ncbi:unnamed protein product [Spirodela intermedia]|uniref:SUN domain-containing protein n=1 Tax=Spirodela intermedia TaxID=51605 RepID=A0A7I8IGJ3_SPIIN|nr:unnamed protein product [Spirodela intermedia]CAA6657010.1 unnamed protein product [Spirodela intermedia]
MSSSTVAIAANSAINALDSDLKSSARRRHAFVAEKKSTVDTVADGENPAVSGDRVVGDGRDGHSVRDEYAQERPRELPRRKGDLTAAPKISLKHKKSPSKADKPRWRTVLSILIKNGLLLTVLLNLGRMGWKWIDLQGEVTRSLFTAPAFVDQISDVEASLRKTTEMLQDRMQAVHSKVDREIGIVKKELTEEIKGRSDSLEKKLRQLETRSDDLEVSLTKLKDTSFFSKDDLQKILDDLRKGQNTVTNTRQVTLDEIRAYARDIIEKEIEKHAADGLERVVRHSEAYSFGKGSWFPVGKGRSGGVHASAHKMLQPSFGEPGQCFPLRGSTGFVEIKLRTGIIPESITIEHVAKSVGYDRSSAPKDCRISATMLTLVEFTYDLGKGNAQTFGAAPSSVGMVNMVRLDFSSNHGNPSYTCLYRLRIHGAEPDPVKMVMGS